jgi:hypothetical protein
VSFKKDGRAALYFTMSDIVHVTTSSNSRLSESCQLCFSENRLQAIRKPPIYNKEIAKFCVKADNSAGNLSYQERKNTESIWKQFRHRWR